MLARKNWFFHLVHIHHIHLSLSLRSTLRACLFGEILERMENLGEKSREKEVLVADWLGGGEEKNVIGFICFLFGLTKMFSLQNGEKIGKSV